MSGSKSFPPQPYVALKMESGSEEIRLCCSVRKYIIFVSYGLLFHQVLNKKNQKVQETGHSDDAQFDISFNFKTPGNWNKSFRLLILFPQELCCLAGKGLFLRVILWS